MNKDFWERLNKLEELAGKATPGEWVAYASGIGGRCIDNINGEDVIHFSIAIKNGNYIAAANPAMILEMIAALRQMEMDIRGLKHDKQILEEATEKSANDNLELRSRLNHLEKETDWLANQLAKSSWGITAKTWREKARKEVNK